MKWLVTLALALWGSAGLAADGAAPKQPSIHEIPVEPMKADTKSSKTLARYKGKVLLIVNVASKCGFTPQYAGLEKLYRRYKDKGLQVLGFPANDFMGQEPGTEEEIVKFCRAKYDVTFPLYAKSHVVGQEKSSLYQYLTGENSPFKGEVRWNFEKFLISRDGLIIGRFRSATKPESERMVQAIEKELATGVAADAAGAPKVNK